MPTYAIDGKEVSLNVLISYIGENESAAFVPKARLDAALKLKDDATEALKAAQSAAGDATKLQKQLDKLTAENADLRASGELAAVGYADPKLQKSLRALHAAEFDGVKDAPTLTEWLTKDGKDHPLVKAYTATQQATPSADTTGTKAPGVVEVEGQPQGKRAPQGQIRSADQLRAYFNSPEYAAKIGPMKPAEREAFLTELQATVAKESAVKP